ncbi:hypothetical protein [Aureivirga sp. CE67]|uniref:hypothetical protein n=1 Tax=Aureivirga sp. CE67 TaxID=1788983 RepID=UPI0018CA289B|nr:hypothetical protein [Aureivirga sp. CE67]
MKFIKTLLIVFALCLGSVYLVYWDIGDRLLLDKLDKTEQIKLAKPRNTIEENYKKEFNNPKFDFPGKEISKIKIYKNTPVISRFTAETLDKKQQEEIIQFFNNPENFSFEKTSWKIPDAEYIIRFFDKNKEEIGKVWLCLNDCEAVKSIPFSAKMKFGSLSEIGKKKIISILEQN